MASRYLAARKGRLTKSIKAMVLAVQHYNIAKRVMREDWLKLDPSERVEVVEAALGATITGTDFENLVDCICC